jgi:delta24(24(1))-sterol reductase
MVTTRSQSVSPRKRITPLNYAQLASSTPGPSPAKRSASATSPSKRVKSPTKKTPRRKSTAPRIMADEIVVKSENDLPDSHPDAEFVIGNGIDKRPRSSRKTSKAGTEMKVKNKPAHKVDSSGRFDFGGSFGTASMMILFPILMYYLWISATFYGGNLQTKRRSESWLAFADRMVAHITKVVNPC